MSNKAIAYYTSTYTQGMATYPCFVIIAELASVTSSNWMFPASLNRLRASFGDLPQLTVRQLKAIEGISRVPEALCTWAEIQDYQTEYHKAILEICRS